METGEPFQNLLVSGGGGRDANTAIYNAKSNVRSVERILPMDYTYFPNTFFKILYISLPFMFYCRYKSTVSMTITLQPSHCTE
jgi:hypothetical protein